MKAFLFLLLTSALWAGICWIASEWLPKDWYPIMIPFAILYGIGMFVGMFHVDGGWGE